MEQPSNRESGGQGGRRAPSRHAADHATYAWPREVLDSGRVVETDVPRLWEARQLPDDPSAVADERFHDEEAAIYDYYGRSPRVACAEAWIVPWMIRHVGPGIVVDLGTGTGRIAQAVARATGQRVIAVDHSRAMLERALERTRGLPVVALRADVTELPIVDASIDTVLCSGVLHHLSRPASSLGEIARVLRPGGVLVIREPNADYPGMWFARLETLVAALHKRATSTAPAPSNACTPYEEPIRGGWLAASLASGFKVEFLGSAKLMASFALPEGCPFAVSFYRLANSIDRALLSRVFSRRGSLLLMVATRAGS